jgi:hypothetical protein
LWVSGLQFQREEAITVTVLSLRPSRPSRSTGRREPGRGARAGGPLGVEDAGLAGRTPIATFARRADAEHALERLAAGRFPMHRTALIATDVKLLEDVGGLSTVRCALLGAAAGSWVGGFLTLFAVLVVRPDLPTVVLALGCVLLCALCGATLGAAAYGAYGRGCTAGRRLVAGRYELYADEQVAVAALRLLLRLRPVGMSPAHTAPAEIVPAA